MLNFKFRTADENSVLENISFGHMWAADWLIFTKNFVRKLSLVITLRAKTNECENFQTSLLLYRHISVKCRQILMKFCSWSRLRQISYYTLSRLNATNFKLTQSPSSKLLYCNTSVKYNSILMKFCTPWQTGTIIYTVFRKKTPTHIFFHISMNDVWI